MLWTFSSNKRAKLMTRLQEKDVYPAQKRTIRDQLLTLAKEALATSKDRFEDIPVRYDEYDD